jgi:hypothetical protein
MKTLEASFRPLGFLEIIWDLVMGIWNSKWSPDPLGKEKFNPCPSRE